MSIISMINILNIDCIGHACYNRAHIETEIETVKTLI